MKSWSDKTPHEKLTALIERVREKPERPLVALLMGETGRGKTFAVQRLYDTLAADSPGYWHAGLTPEWPPASRRSVLNQRKIVIPGEELRSSGEPIQFLWAGIGATTATGAMVGDMSAALGRQIDDLLSAHLLALNQRSRVRGQLFQLAVDAVAELTPIIGRLKTAVDHLREAKEILGGRSEELLERERSTMIEALQASAPSLFRSELSAPPIVVVAMDDAHSADHDCLYLVSGLLTGPSVDRDGDAFLAPASGWRPPMGTLILCTVWPHQLRSASSLFREWLDELERANIDVARVRFDDLSVAAAQDLLDAWPRGPHKRKREQILRHIAGELGNRPIKVNPLVLAESVGLVEEERDPFTDRCEVDEDLLEQLPQSPEQHLEDRLERVREVGAQGRRSLALLQMLTHFNERVFQKFIDLVADAGSMMGYRLGGAETDLLERHGFVQPGRGTSPIWRIDPDVYGYLGRKSLSEQLAKVLDQACSGFLLWLFEECLVDDLAREDAIHLVGVTPMAVAAGQRVLVSDFLRVGESCRDVTLLARAADQRHAFSDPSSADEASDMAVGAAYALGALDRTIARRALKSIEHFGGSTVSVRILDRWIREEGPSLPSDLKERLCLRLDPVSGNPRVARVLAEFLHRDGQTSRAIELLRYPAQINAISALRLAELLVSEGDREAAIRILEPFGDENPNVAIHLAELLIQVGDRAGAQDALRVLARTEPTVARRLAGLLVEGGERGAALDLLRPLKAHSQVTLPLASLLLEEGNRREAIEVLDPLSDTDVQAADMLADLLVEEGNRADAVRVLEQVSRQYPQAACRLAELLHESGESSKAIRALRPHAGSSDPEIAKLLTEILIDIDDVQGAIAIVDGSRHEPFLADHLADLLVGVGQRDRAYVVLAGASERFPHAAHRLADLLIADGKEEQAISVLNRFSGRDEHATSRAAELLYEAGHRDEAIAGLRRHAGALPHVAMTLARLLVMEGDVKEARRILLPHSRSNPIAARELAELLTEDHRDEAIEVLRPFGASDPHAAIQLSDLLLDQDPEEAVQVLLPLSSHDAQAASRVAALMVDQGEPDKAVEVLRPLSRRHPQAARRLAQLLVELGRRDQAIDALSDLTEGGAQVANVTADLLVQDGKSQAAIKVLQPFSRRNGQAARSLADLLIQCGDEAGAIDALRPLHRRDPQVARLLSDQLLQAGNREQAIDALRSVSRNESTSAMRLADLLAGDGRYSEASDVLLPFLGYLGPAVASFATVACQMAEPEYDRAIEQLEHAAAKGRGTRTGAPEYIATVRASIAALRLKSGERDAGLRELVECPEPFEPAADAISRIAAFSGDSELLATVVSSSLTPRREKALARSIGRRFLVLVRRSEGRFASPQVLARRIWVSNEQRLLAQRQLAGSLLSWLDKRPQWFSTAQVVGLMEALVGVAAKFPRQLMNEVSQRLLEGAEDSTKLLSQLEATAQSSPFAERLVRDLADPARTK